MKLLFVTLSALFISLTSSAQIVNYDDVAVIVNDASQTSLNIGDYFRVQRNIPNLNMIHITCSTDEEIDSLEFASIRTQVENYITTNNLTTIINYIVTTKGVPLKISRGDCDLPNANCASLDSEIGLILGAHSSDIGQSGPAMNPYLGSQTHFSSASENIYLVTRLSGYSEGDVLTLIDRSGPDVAMSMVNSNFIFDISGASNAAELTYYTNLLEPVSNSLVNDGWSTTFHPDSSLLTYQNYVTGYIGINLQPSNDVLNNSWANGAISDIFYSFSAGTFDLASNTNNDLIAANLIREGATGAHGYAYHAYASLGLNHQNLFDLYLDTAGHYNLAEAYYSSIKNFSWQSVVIGDPKTSIVIDNTASVAGLNSSDIVIFPNPSNGVISIDFGQLEVKSLTVVNMQGQSLHSGVGYLTNTIDLSGLSEGTYLIRVETLHDVISKKVLILK